MALTPDAEGLFALLDAHPDLMPVADVTPDNAHSEARHRETLGVSCIHCGKPSCKALIATHSKSGGVYWIDLCWKCLPWVREAFERVKERRKNA